MVIMKAGDVTDALCSLLGDMSDPSKKGALTPRNLFNSLRAKLVDMGVCVLIGLGHTRRSSHNVCE